MSNENYDSVAQEAKKLAEDIQSMPSSPVLTFGGAQALAAPGEVEGMTAQAAAQTAVIDDSMLTDAEKKQVSDFAKQIDISDTNSILQYGSGTQKKMADFSDTALENVRTRDLGEVGNLLGDVVKTLKDFDAGKEAGGGILGFLKKPGKKLEEMKIKYDKASSNVDKVSESLTSHQILLMKDIATMDKMYESNLSYYKELTMYILAGKQKIDDVTTNELPQLKAKAQASGLPEDAQAVKDLEDQINRFEKKLHDLELTRMVSIQTAPQIRMIQSNDSLMVEKIQSTLVNTIPLWKNQMVIALGIEDAAKAAEAQNAVTEMTNQLLQENADKLQQTTIATAEASERGIVDLETLQHTNESLIQTLDEVAKIQAEGRTKRAEAEVELQRLENELKDKLLSLKETASE